jgi:asparagine synthase (glutamine-hydrolysing)
MCSALRHYDWYIENRYSDPVAGVAMGRLALGFVNHGEQPASNEDGSLITMMHGELYEADELRRSLRAAGRHIRTESHAELLLHGFEAEGKNFFARLHGCFAAAIWDTNRRRLVLVNDRFGMRPIYIVHANGRLAVASEIKALLADSEVPRTPSERGIAQFFTFGHLLNEDTLWDAVRLAPAAAWLTYDARLDRLECDRYWRLEPQHTTNGATTAELLDRVTDTFERAVSRRVAGDTTLGISLSGGLDSRTILAMIDRDRVPVTTVSMGMAGSMDHQSAEKMAALAGCRHHSCVLDDRVLARFLEQLQATVHLTDGHLLSQGIMQYTLPDYRRLGIQTLLRGHAGELMHMDKAYNYSLDDRAFTLRSEAELEDWLMGRMSDFIVGNVTEPIVAGQPAAELTALARESLREALAASAGMESLADRVAHVFLTQRVRRETALSMQEFGSLVETRLPFVDNDLVELLFALPSRVKLGDQIQSHLLRRRFPAFLDVQNANTGARVGAGPLVRSLSTFRMKVLGKLGVPGYQPYERLGLWLRRELRPLVEQLLLTDRFRDRGILDVTSVSGVVHRHLNGIQNHTYLIMALIVFELAQREFTDRECELWSAVA